MKLRGKEQSRRELVRVLFRSVAARLLSLILQGLIKSGRNVEERHRRRSVVPTNKEGSWHLEATQASGK